MDNTELTIENIRKAMKKLEKSRQDQFLSKKRLRDIQWSMKFRPTPQEISVRRVQLYVDDHPLEVVQLDSNEVSAVELLKGYNDYNRYERVS